MKENLIVVVAGAVNTEHGESKEEFFTVGSQRKGRKFLLIWQRSHKNFLSLSPDEED